ncbi:MAG: choice-of-anchor Q domain-containing protein [Chloroflexota bacterium]
MAVLLIVSAATAQTGSVYYVSPNGSDTNPGSLTAPWRTIDHALTQLYAGDTLTMRGGTYQTVYEGWAFHHSGSDSQPITLTNYPGERVIFAINNRSDNYQAFACWGRDFKADYVRILGTDVSPLTLPNGVVSQKGIVIRGPDLKMAGEYTTSAGFIIRDCDHWEIAGVDFIDVGYGIFTLKDYAASDGPVSTTHWYVHDNRVHGFYAESGMQFNGDHNRIERNVISKVHDQHFTPWGCQMVNLVGYDNMLVENILSEEGSQDFCFGVTVEWDLADFNVIERNQIYDADAGVMFLGGDNNIVRNNLIVMAVESNPFVGGVTLQSTDDPTVNYCNSEPPEIIPPDDVNHPEYAHYYSPRNCHSYGNLIFNNTIYGYHEGVRLYELVPASTRIQNNAIVGWVRGAICPYDADRGVCRPLPDHLTATPNAVDGETGFMDATKFDFSLRSDSPLVDSGADLSMWVLEDLRGIKRPQGGGFDIGAYEYAEYGPTATVAHTVLFHTLNQHAPSDVQVLLVIIMSTHMDIYIEIAGVTGIVTVLVGGRGGLITISQMHPRLVSGLSPPEIYVQALNRYLPDMMAGAFNDIGAQYVAPDLVIDTIRLEPNQLVLRLVQRP